MSRVCAKGHVVEEDYLKVCPHCGASLPGSVGKVRSLAADAPPPVHVPKLVPFLVGAVVLGIFGGLLTYAAESGPAEYFGWLLLAVAVAVAVVGVLDHVRHPRS